MSFRITDLIANGYISAAYQLDVYTSAGSDYLRITDNQVYRPGSGPLYLNWSSNGNVYATGSSGGNMGVGNNSPSYKLHVSGDIYANGGWLRVSGASGLYFESYGGGWRMTGSSYVEMYGSKSVHMVNGSIDYVNQLHFNAGTRFYGYDSHYLNFRTDATDYGGIFLRDGNTSIRSYYAYYDGSGAGQLNSSGQWAIRYNGSAETALFYSGNQKIVTLSGGARITGDLLIDDNYGNGVVGVYSSYRYQGIFAMGNSYKLAADGTTTGNLYGLAWSHPNTGGVAGNLNTHGLLVMENGTFLAAVSGSIRARDDMRAPIFYDSNNTSYYLDPSGSVSLNVAGNIHTQGGGFASNAWSSSSGNEAVRVFAPQGASASWDGGITGALRIRLPQRANNTMWSMKVRIYNYSTNQTAEYTMGNYSYDQGGYNASAHFIGASSAPIYNVRFGNQDGYDCVWIGETGTTWSYPVVSVMDFQGGFRGGNAGTWDDGWNITYVTSFGTIATTIYPSVRLASVYFDNLYYNGNTNYGITSTNGYFDTVNTGSSGDPLELNYYRTGPVYVGPNGGDNTIRASSFYLYNSGGQIYAINGSYIGYSTWLQSSGTHGLYSPSSGSGTHWYPAASYTYGSWYMEGFRNGYIGILLYGTAGPTTIMYDSSGNGGVYRQGSDWHYYWSASNTCLGINGSTTSSTYALYVNGKGIYSVGDVVAYSDIRKKKDIVTIDNALDKVLDMRGVYYIRKDQEEKGRQTGVIAQEVETVLPEVVTYAKDTDEYGVAYGNMAGLFIEAFKEQQKLIQELRSEIEVLKSKI